MQGFLPMTSLSVTFAEFGSEESRDTLLSTGTEFVLSWAVKSVEVVATMSIEEPKDISDG